VKQERGEILWEYKLAEDETNVFGPFTTADMNAWQEGVTILSIPLEYKIPSSDGSFCRVIFRVHLFLYVKLENLNLCLVVLLRLPSIFNIKPISPHLK
jgi:hypothetical protein